MTDGVTLTKFFVKEQSNKAALPGLASTVDYKIIHVICAGLGRGESPQVRTQKGGV